MLIYFKVFHKAIAFNEFLFKINIKDSPNCDFCKTITESFIHVFCECDTIKFIWDDLVKIIQDKEVFQFPILKRCLGFIKINFLPIYFYV